MNVGALIPTDYGYYFNWGGTTDVTSTTIDLGWNNNCPYWAGTSSTDIKFSKYVPTGSSYWGGSGTADNKTTLEAADDAARANWGGSWRMPTEAEFTALLNNTARTWQSNYNSSGHAGYLFTGKGDYANKSIFLPAAGGRNGTLLLDQGSHGYYWSSSLNTILPGYGRYLYFYSGNAGMYDCNRCYGRSVRPVHD